MPRTLLILDDSTPTRTFIRHHADTSQMGVSLILEASTACEAFDLLSAIRVDLVIMNVQVPDMPAADIIARLQNLSLHRILFVLIMDEKSIVDIGAFYTLGASGHLRKPFTPGELRAVLTPLLKCAATESCPAGE